MRIWLVDGMLIASTVGAYLVLPMCLKSTRFPDWLRWA